MANSISLKTIEKFQKKYESDHHVKVARNAMIRTDLSDLTINWDRYRSINHSFSNIVKGEMTVTNQKSSGRCWGFAGLNLFRFYIGRKHNLKNFEFSQSYFMFWDKLEKANYFLECIIDSAAEDWNSRMVMHLLSNPIEDGGQWDMWVSLIDKYGVIPQSEMSESFSSSQSSTMNRMIARKLRENAKDLRQNISKGVSGDDLETIKTDMLEQIYKMLTMHIGIPPTSFNWQTYDKKKNFISFENLTPKSFFDDHVGLNLDEYVCLINCPMEDKEYRKVYTVEALGNVVEGNSVRYLNVTSEEMKATSVSSIKDDHPVWFGCDVGKHFDRKLGVMDMDLFDFNSFYQSSFSMNKADRLQYGESQMTHAMLFTGVDLDANDKPIKWRVENSWGNKVGDKGYHIMSYQWFDEYNYEVVVHKDYLSDDLYNLYKNEEAIPLKPWDPMGSLAK